MNKNEILEKSRKEYHNNLDDERDKSNNLKKRSFALGFGAVVLVLTYLYKKCFRMYTYDLGLLLWSCVLGYFLCSAKLKEKYAWAPILLAAGFLLANLVGFLMLPWLVEQPHHALFLP